MFGGRGWRLSGAGNAGGEDESGGEEQVAVVGHLVLRGESKLEIGKLKLEKRKADRSLRSG